MEENRKKRNCEVKNLETYEICKDLGVYILFSNEVFKIDGIIIYSEIDHGKKCLLKVVPNLIDTWKDEVPKERLPLLPNPYLTIKETWGFCLEVSDQLKEIRRLDKYEESLRLFIEWILKHPKTKIKKEYFEKEVIRSGRF